MPSLPPIVRASGALAALALCAAAGPHAALVDPPAAAAAVVPAPPAARVVTITATDFAFQMPDTVAAGRTEFQLVSQGKELHHAAIFRLEGGKTMADLFAALKAGGPLPAWARAVGGPNARVPGVASVAALDLEPGAYAALCVIPSPDGTPHVMKGMARAFTVVPARRATPAAFRAGAAAPAAAAITRAPDVTMTLDDYSFRLSRPLTRGRHVVRVRNAAAQQHEVFVVRLAPGKTVADAVAWTEKLQGPPPMEPLGGTAGMDTGVSNDIALDLTPGEYAFLCFVPDAKDGKPHLAHGMMQQFTVR